MSADVGYDNGSQHHYIYDASGERVLKGKSTGQRIFVNGEWKAGSGQMGNYTVYVNPYLVLKSGGYTKHYYIEGQRIVSKLGGGWDNNGKAPLKAGENKVDYVGKTQKVFDGIVKNLKFLGADGQILTAGKSGKIPPGQINGTGGANVTESFRYFYHPDHLGSTSYVTDVSGEVYQHVEYFAFGETFVEEHSNTDRTPFLFNGKELDEETGLYYYGSRYYDPRSSVWQSVDPLAEKFPGMSPYNYCANNPVVSIDPNGEENIIVVGGADIANKNRYNFIQSGLKQFKNYIQNQPNEKTTLVVSTAFMTKSEKAQIEYRARLMEGYGKNVNVVFVDSDKQLTNYLNSADKSQSGISQARKDDKITDVSFFGHGYSSSVEPGHGGDAAAHSQFKWDKDDVAELSPEAFAAGSVVDFFTCNAATDNGSSNLAKDVSTVTQGTATGFKGTTTYRFINNPKATVMKILGRLGLRDTPVRPADNLPQGSSGSTKRTYVNGVETTN